MCISHLANDQKKLVIKAWAKNTPEVDNLLQEALHTVFGLEDFRPMQKAAIKAGLMRKDIVVVQPTGKIPTSLIFLECN